MRARGARLLLALAVAGAAMSGPALPAGAAAAPIHLTRFDSAGAFAAGDTLGTTVDAPGVSLAPGDVTGTWVSPPIEPGFAFDRLVASWNAAMPSQTRLRVEVQTTTAAGQVSPWYVLGKWAADDVAGGRSSVNAQTDALGQVDTDTLAARGSPVVSYALRATLERSSVEDAAPSIRLLAVQVSAFSYSASMPTSSPLSLDPVELAVPPLSQEVHAGHYPQWGGGGEAWCSPTSTQMVVEFWGRGPTADDLTWVEPSHADPSVEYAARGTYDPAYRGTGNWPFNTAYAAGFGLTAFVTQLRSLAEAEQLVRAGIPLVASIAARPGELAGFLFPGGTSGHLVVIVGFAADGRPIVNDPAAWTNASVRRVYDRAQFERVWLRGSAGTVYVIHPPDVALPAPPADATPNW